MGCPKRLGSKGSAQENDLGSDDRCRPAQFSAEPPSQSVKSTAAGNGAQALMGAAGGLGGDQPEIGHKLARVSEAVDITQFTD